MPILEVIYGTGRGKTTNAVGKLFKELGMDKRIVIIQFLKTGKDCGECNYFKQEKRIKWFYFGTEDFYIPGKEKEGIQELLKTGIYEVLNYLKQNFCEILILDEVGIALYYDLIEWKLLRNLFQLVVVHQWRTEF